MNRDPMHAPIPPDPIPGCDYEWEDGIHATKSSCLKDGETLIEDDYWLCKEHYDDHYNSEQADMGVKASKEQE